MIRVAGQIQSIPGPIAIQAHPFLAKQCYFRPDILTGLRLIHPNLCQMILSQAHLVYYIVPFHFRVASLQAHPYLGLKRLI